MDPPNKRRRLAPKLPDPPQPPPGYPSSLPAQSASAEQPYPAATAAAAPTSSAPDAAARPAPRERHEFEAFAKHLQDAAMYIYSQGQKAPYGNVSALLLKWDDDIAASADVSSLERVLHDRYNFHTERWGIPAVANPTPKLGARIADFLNQATADHLLILYYVGYGFVGTDNHLYWACNAREDSPRLKWSGVRGMFDDAQSDVLVLLDSCASRDTPIAGSHGAKQMIAACTPESFPREQGSRTFTSHLVDSLHKLGNGRPFNVQRLYDEIQAAQHSHDRQPLSRLVNGGSKPAALRSQAPVFLTLNPGKGQTIDLAPMPRSQHQSPQNGMHLESKTRNGQPADRDPPVISPAAVSDLVFAEPRVLVCTTFVADASPDMTCFNQWLASSVPLASQVAVEGMFLGPPTVLLISIPQSLWRIIQHDNICFSLGYVNSKNLINLYDGLMRTASAATLTSTPSLGVYASAKDVEDGRTLLEAREAAVNNSATGYQNNSYQHASYYQPRQQAIPPATLPPPTPSAPAQSQQILPPLPPPRPQHSQQLPPPSYRDPGSGNHFPPSLQLQDSLAQQQQHQQQQQHHHHHHFPLHQVQQGNSPPPRTPLPPILSRPGSPVTKVEREDSAEVKEAAEQLKALSHIRAENGEIPPLLASMTSSHLSKIAQDVIKCQGDASKQEDVDMAGADDGVSPGGKKIKAKRDYRFKRTKTQDSQGGGGRPRTHSDIASLSHLQPQDPKADAQCNYCSHEPFKDVAALRKHIAAAHTRPFPCAFAFAGCTSTFGSKNEWKRHVASQHLCLQYYRCSSCSQSTADGKGNEFNRKDLFTQHLRRMHAPIYIRKAMQKRDTKVETEWEDYVKDMQKTCCIIRRLPPQRSACPKAGCNRSFEGRSAWDEWTEHVGRHMESGEGESLGVDRLLVSWALDEGIIMQAEDGVYRLCNPMGSNSNGGSNNNSGLIGSSRHSHGSGGGGSSKNASLSNISVASFPSEKDKTSLDQRSEKLVTPPTPPPTTTATHQPPQHLPPVTGVPDKQDEAVSIGVQKEKVALTAEHEPGRTAAPEQDESEEKTEKRGPETDTANKEISEREAGGPQEPGKLQEAKETKQASETKETGEKGTQEKQEAKETQKETQKETEPPKDTKGEDKAELASITVATAVAAAAAVDAADAAQQEAPKASGAMEIDG